MRARPAFTLRPDIRGSTDGDLLLCHCRLYVYLGVVGVAVVGECGGGGRQLVDAARALELGRSVRVEEQVVVRGRQGDRVGVRQERGRQDPDGRRRTVGRLDLLHDRLRQVRSHEDRHEAVFRDRYVSTSTTTTTFTDALATQCAVHGLCNGRVVKFFSSIRDFNLHQSHPEYATETARGSTRKKGRCDGKSSR